MNINLDIPWTLIHSFQTVAEEGSLLAASRKLGLTQPTVGRHIDLLEERLKTPLFTRGREGMALTGKGADLVASAQQMGAGAERFHRVAAGLEEDLAGTVRLAANDVFGVLLLPSVLARLRAETPEIAIELAISNSAANLSRRDADIAVRLVRPTQNDLIARKIADLPLGFFAHRRYLSRAGHPRTLQDVVAGTFIGFDRDTSLIDAAAAMGLALSPADFAYRTDNVLAQFAAIQAGVGVGITHKGIAAGWPDVDEVLPEIALPTLPLWLVCHADIRHGPRIRRVMDFLGAALRTPYAGLS